MFFVDKYCPQTIEDAQFHKKELKQLEIMAADESIPHIIFYGPSGSGKKTVIKLFLEMLYDENVNKLVDADYNVTGSGNSSTQVTIKQSDYHIVIEPKNNNFDRYLIRDVVKEYAKKVQLDVFTSKKYFKTVLINNIDNMSYYAQTSLRRTMEKYSNNCRFIMWSRSLSKVIDPLRSRSHLFPIRSPPYEQISNVILDIAHKESIPIDIDKFNNIIKEANGNIKIVMWYLQFLQMGEDFSNSYRDAIVEIAELIKECDIEEFSQIRTLMYRCMITNIDGTHLIKDLTDYLLGDETISNEKKYKIINIAAVIEHRLVLGRRQIINLDAYTARVMKVLNASD